MIHQEQLHFLGHILRKLEDEQVNKYTFSILGMANAKLVTQSLICSNVDHITPVLSDLHWLPVSYHIVFKILLLVFKSLNNLSPSYLADRLSYQSHSRNLRSASKQLLEQPRSFMKTYRNKAFSVCAPKLWNSLPLDLRKSPSLTGFKKGLKTYLFRQFLESGSLFL